MIITIRAPYRTVSVTVWKDKRNLIRHNFSIRIQLFIEHVYQLFSECPASHPNVYHNGQHCCKSNKEKVYSTQGTKCDGGVLQRDSLCCHDDQHIPCPSGNCENYKGLELGESFRFWIIAFLRKRKGVKWWNGMCKVSESWIWLSRFYHS